MSKGFYFDANRCIGCRVCQVACKDRLGLEMAGPLTRRVKTFETGKYPNVSLFHTSIACNHCEKPACVANCPTGAMFKDADGIVLHDDKRCIVCKNCVWACPYGAPQYVKELKLIIKCDSCKALRDAGKNPVCVDACMVRALKFGDVEDLKSEYGSDLVSKLPSTPSADITTPNLLIKPKAASLEGKFQELVL